MLQIKYLPDLRWANIFLIYRSITWQTLDSCCTCEGQSSLNPFNDRKVSLLHLISRLFSSPRISSTSPTRTLSQFRLSILPSRVWSLTQWLLRPRYITWPPSSPAHRNRWVSHKMIHIKTHNSNICHAVSSYPSFLNFLQYTIKIDLPITDKGLK